METRMESEDMHLVFRPLMMISQFLGYTYHKHRVGPSTTINKVILTVSITYSVILNVVYWGNIGILMTCVVKWSSDVGVNLSRLNALLISLLFAATASCSLRRLTNGVRTFTLLTQRLNGIVRRPTIMRRCRCIVRVVTIVSVCAAAVMLIEGILNAQYLDPEIMNIHCLSAPVEPESSLAGSFVIGKIVVMQFSVLGISFIVSLMFLTVIVIRAEITIFSQHVDTMLKREVTSNGSGDPITFDEVQSLNAWYRSLVKLSTVGNQSFRAVIALFYVTVIPSICLVMYSASRNTLSVEALASNAGTLSVTVLTTIVITLLGISLYEKGEGLFQHLSQFTMETMDARTIALMSVLLNRVRVSEIGFTALDFFVVNRDAALMLIGTLVTYAVIVYQMKPTTEYTAVNDGRPFNCSLLLNCSLPCS